MTTDTKAVARWAVLGPRATMGPSESGEVVLFTEHERVVGELTREAKGLSQSLTETFKSEEELRTALAASRAEVEGLKKDAERYRWLKDTPWTENHEFALVIQCQMNAIWDETIDAAMENGNV